MLLNRVLLHSGVNDTALLPEVVAVPINAGVFPLDTDVRILRQTDAHNLHEITYRPFREVFLVVDQVVEEDVLLEAGIRLFVHACRKSWGTFRVCQLIDVVL